MSVTVRLLLAIATFLLLAGTAMAEKLPDTIVLSPKALKQTRQRVIQRDPALMPAYRFLLKQAREAMVAPAQSVILKPAAPPGGTKHDYWSLSPYWWPDPESRNGLPFIRRDGERNPEADSAKYDRHRLGRIAAGAMTLALAYYLTGSEEFAGKGTALIWAWCCDSVTRANPNMTFARARPGIASGHHTGIIETRELIQVVDAARLLEPSHSWSKAVSRKVMNWFAEYMHWLRTSQFGKQEANMANHHGTWYDAQLAVFALFTGQTTMARSIVGTNATRRLVFQMERNGAMPAELDRSRSRHSTFLTLEAFFTLAAVGERVGVDLWHWSDPASGVSIRKGFDFAARYVAGEEPWPFGDIGAYDPFDFTPLFHRAALVYKDDGYLDFLNALPADKRARDRAKLFH